MNREIKFRAWDGEQMRYEFLVARPQSVDVLSILMDEDFAKKWYGLKEWKVMQFTGLRDKKGNKELYDGDIIAHSSRNGGNPHVVKWSYSQNGWIGDYRLQYPLVSTELVEIEIIGNIYENKELLK